MLKANIFPRQIKIYLDLTQILIYLDNREPPAPVNLIAMGNTTPHTKDFFQKLESAKEIINLIKASILYYSLHPPNSTAPRTIEYRSACIPRWSRVLSYPSPVAPASNLVGCCV